MKILVASLVSLAMFSQIACTGAVAPEREAVKSQAGGTGTGAGTASGTGGGSAGSGGSGGSNTGGGTGSGNQTPAKGAGEIKSESGSLGLKGKSAYAMYSEITQSGVTVKSVSVNITEGAVDEASLTKEIAKYECKKQPAKEETKIKSILINFANLFQDNEDGYTTKDSAFPKNGDVVLEGDLIKDSPKGVTLSYAAGSDTDTMSGTVNVKDLTKVGNTFKLEIKSLKTKKGGKEYKASITGKVLKAPKLPTPPTCKDGEVATPVYK